MFQHFLMTRFNLATPGREKAIRNKAGWLDYRFDLFERFCLPSVVAQSCGKFKWIVYFDHEIPDKYRERIRVLSAGGAFFPYYTPLFDEGGWARSLFETFEIVEDLVLTTGLDSDDALSRDFVDRLQTEVRSNGNMVGSYNFDFGLVRRGGSLYRIKHRSNPFFSYLAQTDKSMKSAPAILHMHIAEAGRVFHLGGDPAWMQIVHDRNVSNKIRGWRVRNEGISDRFAGDAGLDLAEVGGLPVLLENATLGVLRSLRDELSFAVHRLR